MGARVRPGAWAIWTEGAGPTALFFKDDTGTELHPTPMTKVDNYALCYRTGVGRCCLATQPTPSAHPATPHSGPRPAPNGCAGPVCALVGLPQVPVSRSCWPAARGGGLGR